MSVAGVKTFPLLFPQTEVYCKGHCYSMLGSLSSLGELVKLFIILLSEDSTQNKLGLTQVSNLVCVEVSKVC